MQIPRPRLESLATSVECDQSFGRPDPQASLEVYRDAWLEKHGEPDVSLISDIGLMNDLKWLFPSSASTASARMVGLALLCH